MKTAGSAGGAGGGLPAEPRVGRAGAAAGSVGAGGGRAGLNKHKHGLFHGFALPNRSRHDSPREAKRRLARLPEDQPAPASPAPPPRKQMPARKGRRRHYAPPMTGKSPVGKTGRITSGGAIPAGGNHLGEVMVDGQTYFALASDREAIAAHTQVLVIELNPPRTVIVTTLN